MPKTYLITGGAGFIGSHLVDKLLDQGNNIICLDNFDDFYDPEIKRNNIKEASKNTGFQLTEGDIRDRKTLDNCFRNGNIDTVIHIAARAGVRPSIEKPELYYDVNVRGTLTLLEAMKEYDVKKMIFASSSSVYGNNKKVPFSEDDNVDFPISPYAATKKTCELMCHNYHHLYGFNIFCLRFFTVYGPRQRPEMAIHDFARKIINGDKITLFGDGNSKRDYTYIDDIISGITGAIDNLEGYEIINLGNSDTITLNDLVRMLEHATGEKAITERLPKQPGDVDITYADITKARNLLGYNPQYPVERGLIEFVDWMMDVGLSRGGA